MTRLEENIGKTVGALLLVGIGWIGTMIDSNNEMTIQNQVALSENKVLILELQRDIQEMRFVIANIQERMSTVENKVAVNEQSISYLAKEKGL